jgi:hypothetical protein
MTNAQAIGESIKHWKRMIRWAKKQKANGSAKILVMAKSLHEHWKGNHCPLCKKYTDIYDYVDCFKCPLAKRYGECSGSNNIKGNNWQNVNSSTNWKVWIKEAKIMLKQLKSLVRKRSVATSLSRDN